jgi:hypothetical protein
MQLCEDCKFAVIKVKVKEDGTLHLAIAGKKVRCKQGLWKDYEGEERTFTYKTFRKGSKILEENHNNCSFYEGEEDFSKIVVTYSLLNKEIRELEEEGVDTSFLNDIEQYETIPCTITEIVDASDVSWEPASGNEERLDVIIYDPKLKNN